MTDGRGVADFLASIKTRVDTRLDGLLPPVDRFPERLHEAIRYSVIDGGKRVRPALMAAAAEALGADVERLLPAMCAVEMIHVCSLILDDLPSMDDAEIRHGKQTNHVVYGEATAILASIALLNQAYAILSDSASDREGTRAPVISEAVRMVGTAGMIAGQAVDIEATGKPIGEDLLEYIESHKTGALIVGAVRIAAVLAGARPDALDALTTFARHLGVAYQLADDILNLTRRPEDLGKLAHRDEATVNYARTHGLDDSRRSLEEHTDKAVAALATFDERADRLRDLARFLAARAT